MTDLHRLIFAEGPQTVVQMFVSEGHGLWPSEHGERITFTPPAELQDGEELWTDFDGRYWIRTKNVMRSQDVIREPFERSVFHANNGVRGRVFHQPQGILVDKGQNCRQEGEEETR